MSKKALVILADGFEEIEAVTVIDVLRRARIEVTAAGLAGLQVKGSRGITVVADKKLEDAAGDFDCLVLPGGSRGAENLHASTKVNELIKQMFVGGKLIAAICAAPSVVLAPTEILKGRSVTGYPGMLDNFDKTTKYLEQAVVSDATLLTSRGPGTALAFALAIVEKLAGKESADTVREATLYSCS